MAVRGNSARAIQIPPNRITAATGSAFRKGVVQGPGRPVAWMALMPR